MVKKTAVITGGAGFIGSHLCDAFLENDFRVIAVDNLLTGNLQNLSHLRRDKNFELIEHNICQEINISDPVQYVLHFASPASPLDYANLPIQTLKVGSLGTHNALGLAKAKKAVFLLASTSEVYGDPLVHPQPEEYWGNVNPVGPRGVYDEAKRFAEALSMAYFHVHKIDVKIVRIFNTYGPRMRLNDGRAIPAFISAALSNHPLPVFGDGCQTRSFCYVADMVRGIVKAAFSTLNEPINIGNPAEMSVLELAQKIIAMTASKSRVLFHPLPVDDPKVRQPDISKARQKLAWQPTVSLEEGLSKTIQYFKASMQHSNG